jgi:hypothetical protein
MEVHSKVERVNVHHPRSGHGEHPHHIVADEAAED